MIIKTEELTHTDYQTYRDYIDALEMVFGDGVEIDSKLDGKFVTGIYVVNLDKTYWSPLRRFDDKNNSKHEAKGDAAFRLHSDEPKG